MDKKNLTEQEIRTRFITPAIKEAGWKSIQINEEFTLGRIFSRGKYVWRGKRKRADYLLSINKNLPLAIIEAKDNKHSIGSGMQQALSYARMLDIPFVYSSNGDGFLEHDRTKSSGEVEKLIQLDQFPSPQDLWQRYKEWKNLSDGEEKTISQPYFPGKKTPRYYQRVAINRTIEAITQGQKRILLVMATGTGKTFTAFQIMWRLWKTRKMKRILFLADRNILIDQALRNDFKPFGSAMTKISNHQVNKAYEIFLSLYQAVSGTEEDRNIYKQFSPDFFDLIIVDECHRGSAAEDSAWREILEYFHSATQIGLTATPKETQKISNIDYFGEPVYKYSLKQGIEDGFLAPYRVIRYHLDRDIEGWQPEVGQRDVFGQELPDEVFYGPDFDKKLILDERTKLVASLITEYMQKTDPYQKTIVFCVNIDHAERLRQALVNENALEVMLDDRFVMRITGDSPEGKMELENFIDPAEKYPVIATTSKLLNTGVDVQTCKLIVLDSNINSMTEFKQIIGRGTRVREDYGKYTFTIMDFRNATRLFQDPEFDGEPISILEGPPEDLKTIKGETEEIPEDLLDDDSPENEETQRRIYRVKGVPVQVLAERVQYYDKDGKLVTETLTNYSRKNISRVFPTLQSFLTQWDQAERKDVIIEELEKEGVFWQELATEVGENAQNLDPFDLICHIAYDVKPLTRSERARKVRQKPAYLQTYQEKARKVLDAILDQYADNGYDAFDWMLDGAGLSNALSVPPFNQLGKPVELIRAFGSRAEFNKALLDLQKEIYS